MSLKVGTDAEMHLAGQNLMLAKANKELREKLQTLEEENKILREAVEKYKKELRLCYSEDHKDFYPKEIDIELDKALEKVGGGE